MVVRRGIRIVPYYLYEPMKRRKTIEKQHKESTKFISFQTLFICRCVCVYVCAILSLVLLISNNLPSLTHPSPIEKHKFLTCMTLSNCRPCAHGGHIVQLFSRYREIVSAIAHVIDVLLNQTLYYMI